MMRTLLVCTCFLVPAAHATEVSVLGLFPGKALLVIDGAPPKTYAVGDKLGAGTTLVGVDSGAATVDENGRRSSVAVGQYVGHASSGQGSVTLAADSRGHFVADGKINGLGVRMMVDTGATYVAIPGSEAFRLGIDYRRGRLERAGTANGPVTVYRIRLDSVRLGDIELLQVEAVVQEVGLPYILLGNSFLNRCDMRRNAQQMTLTRRF